MVTCQTPGGHYYNINDETKLMGLANLRYVEELHLWWINDFPAPV